MLFHLKLNYTPIYHCFNSCQKHHSVPTPDVGFFTWGSRSSIYMYTIQLWLMTKLKKVHHALSASTKESFLFKTCYRPSVPGGSSDTLYYYQPRVSPTSKTLSLENVFNLGQLRGFVPLFQWDFNSGGKNKRYLKLVALLCQIWILLPCALWFTSEAHFTTIFIHHQLQMQSTSKHH